MSSVHGKLRAPAAAKSGDERRRSQRTAEPITAWLTSPTAAATESKLAVNGLNICKHGLAFSVDRAVAVGAYLKLQSAATDKPAEREILILRCTPLADGKFGVGAEFA